MHNFIVGEIQDAALIYGATEAGGLGSYGRQIFCYHIIEQRRLWSFGS